MSIVSKLYSVVIVVTLISIVTGSAFATERVLARHGEGYSSASAVDGKKYFDRQWQAGPALKGGGLGPVYNARSCVACHINHGRGRPPIDSNDDPSFLLRLSVGPSNEAERMSLAMEEKSIINHPIYGGQLQGHAVDGYRSEGTVKVRYVDKPFVFDDGSIATLHRPIYSVVDASGAPLKIKALISPRIAQSVLGAGQIDAVSEIEILKYEDPRDEDGDGISGRANRVRNLKIGSISIGRFGWKATQPTLIQQTAAAFSQDIGLSSEFFPENLSSCNDDKITCVTDNSKSKNRQNFELQFWQLDSVAAYLRLQALPYRPPATGKRRVGELLFASIGCVACHRTSMEATMVVSREGRTISLPIFPFSDLLLHDMGAALADHRPVAQASGWEWRTQPLWGIGQVGKINDNKFFLHDGRARTITEAILWHGGEARKARSKFAALSKKQRDALLEFVRGL